MAFAVIWQTGGYSLPLVGSRRWGPYRERIQHTSGPPLAGNCVWCPTNMIMEAVFFDAAGTLIRLKQSVGHSYAEIVRAQGVELDPAKLEEAFRWVWKQAAPPVHTGPAPDDDRGWWAALVDRVFERAGMTGRVGDCLFDQLYEHFAQPGTWEVFPDVRPALERLAVRYRLFVLSNFDRRLRRILAGHGLDRWFENMIISSEVGVSKPHPKIFRAALELAGVEPARCLHVGDEIHADGDGAQRAGMQFFHVQRPEQGLDRILR